jgi:hypothetical protein
MKGKFPIIPVLIGLVVLLLLVVIIVVPILVTARRGSNKPSFVRSQTVNSPPPTKSPKEPYTIENPTIG